jgi:hypothetical protein
MLNNQLFLLVLQDAEKMLPHRTSNFSYRMTKQWSGADQAVVTA